MSDEKPTQDPKTGRFLTGGAGGRARGARNKLSAAFVQDLLDHWFMTAAAKAADALPRGQAAIEIVFRESPRDYLKLVASVLPKEIKIEDNRFDEIGDDELAAVITDLRRKASERARSESTGSGGAGTEPTLN